MPKRSRNPDHREIYTLIRDNTDKIAENTATIAGIRTDLKWLKHGLMKVDRRLWWVLAGIIAMGLLGILAALVG